MMPRPKRQSVSKLYLQRQEAFNIGSDARIAGYGPDACPYFSGVMSDAWIDGWSDVDRCWGKYVKGRWGVTPLPKVA